MIKSLAKHRSASMMRGLAKSVDASHERSHDEVVGALSMDPHM
jgi:hypothetical protein